MSHGYARRGLGNVDTIACLAPLFVPLEPEGAGVLCVWSRLLLDARVLRWYVEHRPMLGGCL